MRLILAGLCASLAALGSGCSVVAAKPVAGPDASAGIAQVSAVQINIVPDATGVRARYALPGLAKVFAFRDNASNIRTDTWSTPTAGARVERNHMALGDGARVFEIDLRPDTQQRDRIYPSLTPVGEGWLIYAPQLLPPEASGQPYDINFTLPEGWTVIGSRDADGKLTLDGWVFAGPDSLVDEGTIDVVTAPSTPAWLRQQILDAANDTAVFFGKRLDAALETRPGIIIGYDQASNANSMRGDVTPGSMMSVRFYGDVWREREPASANQVREFLAHEIFHFWNGGVAASADAAERPWLHEGGASYAALLAFDPAPGPADANLVARLNDNLVECQSALDDVESLKTAGRLQFGSAPYACGVVLQWAWDAGLRSYSSGARDVLWLWKAMIADARSNDGKYALADAVQLTPTAAAGAANILLDQTRADRWSVFAEAMRGYGAELTLARDPDDDRATAVMHVLDQHCTGQRGYTTFASHLLLDTGARCGPLDGDKAFDAVSGVSMFGDGSALNDKIRDICAAGGRVEFAREGVVVAAAPCTAPLPPARPVFRIVRAFG